MMSEMECFKEENPKCDSCNIEDLDNSSSPGPGLFTLKCHVVDISQKISQGDCQVQNKHGGLPFDVSKQVRDWCEQPLP